MHKRTKLSIAAVLAISGLAQAQAQDAPAQSLERVEVTGSRIRQVDAESAQPVEKITAAQIQKSGLVTVGDILNSLSSAGSPDFSKGSALTSNAEEGGQYINMRNLGSQRVLVLVNGKRWTRSVGGFTDVSTIPSALIDHIDIQKDGGSSVYGTDAIAGVINIVLVKTMDGAKASVYYGANSKGDGITKDASFNMGANTDHSSLLFGVNYSAQEPVWARTRDITSQSYGTGADQFGVGFGTGPWGRITSLIGAPAGTLPGSMVLNHTGNYTGVGVGQASNVAGNYHAYSSSNADDKYNSSQDMMFQIGSELKSIFTKGSIDINENIRANVTAMYADRKSTAQVAGYPLSSTSQPGYPVYVSKDSYYNPYGNQARGAGNGYDVAFTRRTIEVPRVTINDSRSTHLDGGLEGDFTLAGHPWYWDVGVNYSKNAGTETETGNLNLPNLKQALGPSFMNSSGVVQCGTPSAPIGLAACTPFNILGGPSASTPAALNYVMSTSQPNYGSTVRELFANINGEVMKLPAGPLSVAVGVDQSTITGYQTLDQIDQDALTTNLAGFNTAGRYTVKEAYLETIIPLLKGVPGAEKLSVDLATRYSDYSNFGNTTNSKGSIEWKPIKDLLVRGTVSQGFRAPAIGDTFGGGSQSFDFLLDPCDTVYGTAKSNATTQANCAAAGVPGTYRQVNQSGAAITSGAAVQGIAPFFVGAGNPYLQPEKAKTDTAGFVYNPSYLPGLNVGVDWYRIDITNVITAISANYVLQQCYDKSITTFCSSIQRDPTTHQIISMARGNANLGALLTQGFDFDIGYKFKPTPYGQFEIGSSSTWVTKYSTKSTDTSDWQDFTATYPIYRLKSNVTLNWKLNNWSATWTAHYYSSLKSTCWDSSDTSTCSNPDSTWVNGSGPGNGYNRLGAQVFHDISVGYKLPWKGEILVGANNAFYKKPRINYDTNGASSSSSSVDPDLPIDRFLWVRYTQSF